MYNYHNHVWRFRADLTLDHCQGGIGNGQGVVACSQQVFTCLQRFLWRTLDIYIASARAHCISFHSNDLILRFLVSERRPMYVCYVQQEERFESPPKWLNNCLIYRVPNNGLSSLGETSVYFLWKQVCRANGDQ
jgi:hypothetical protein